MIQCFVLSSISRMFFARHMITDEMGNLIMEDMKFYFFSRSSASLSLPYLVAGTVVMLNHRSACLRSLLKSCEPFCLFPFALLLTNVEST